jgi:two-component system phosphate regulon response regulator PhoB
MSDNMIDKMPPKVMMVDFDEESRNSASNAIERYWFNVIRIAEPDMALRNLALYGPNLGVISTRMSNVLDLSPASSGQSSTSLKVIEFINKIRAMKGFAQMPIILLIEDYDKHDYAELDNGLFEIIRRPFSHNELIIAIKSLFRKSQPVLQDRILKYKDVTIDLGSFKAFRQDMHMHLGPTEFKILQLLVQSPKAIFSRQQIIDYVWGAECTEIDLRTVDVHMNRLRTALKKISKVPVIQTIRSLGYCLSLPGDPD